MEVRVRKDTQGYLKWEGRAQGQKAKGGRAGNIVYISWVASPGLHPLQHKGQERLWEEDALEQGWEGELSGVVWPRANTDERN